MTKYTPKISFKEIVTIVKLRFIETYNNIKNDIEVKRIINGMVGLMDKENNSKWSDCAVPDDVAIIRNIAKANYIKPDEQSND